MATEREQTIEATIIARKIMGARMKYLRIEKGITYAQMQRNSILSPGQIAAIESGSTSYTVDSLLQYLVAADLSFPLDLPIHKYLDYTIQGYSVEDAIAQVEKDEGADR